MSEQTFSQPTAKENMYKGLPGGNMPDPHRFDIGGTTNLVGNNLVVEPKIISEANLIENKTPVDLPEGKLGDSKEFMDSIVDGPKMKATSDIDPKDLSVEQLLAGLFGGGGKENGSLILTRKDLLSQVLTGMRGLAEDDDNPEIANEYRDHWTGTGAHTSFVERMKAFKKPINELEAIQIIKKGTYDSKTGYAEITDPDFAIYALRVDIINGKKAYYFGKDQAVAGKLRKADEERVEKARGFEIVYREMSIRKIIGNYVAIDMGPQRDDLEGMVETAHTRAQKLTVLHLEEIWNLPAADRVDANINDHTFGNQIELAMMLYEGMLASATQEGMRLFLRRPRVKELIAIYNLDSIKIFGNVEKWTPDEDRTISTKNGAVPTFVLEAEAGLRGTVTDLANMTCYAGRGGEKLSFGLEEDFIKKIGATVGSLDASWFAAGLLRGLGEFSSKGFIALPNGEFALPLGENQFVSGSDKGKGFVQLRALSELMKGRPTMLKDLFNRVPDMALSFFEWTQVMTKYGRRSMIDAWLGTPAGMEIKDVLTGKVVGATVEEAGMRLGSLDYKSLQRGAGNAYFQMEWLKYREGMGVLTLLLKTQFAEADLSPDMMKKLWKYITIALNNITLTKGSTQLFDMSRVDEVRVNLMKNRHAAVKSSASFIMGVGQGIIKLFKPGTTEMEESSVADFLDKNMDALLDVISGKRKLEEVEDVFSTDDWAVLSTLANKSNVQKVLQKVRFTEFDESGIMTGPPIEPRKKHSIAGHIVRRLMGLKNN